MPKVMKQEPLALPAPVGQELVPVKEAAQGSNLQEGDEKANAREYNDLMDAYSLHQFMIRKGKVIDTTPEYASYKRTYAAHWGEITVVIHALEKLLGEYNVPLAYIDGKKAAKLAMDPFKKWTVDDLLNCVANQDTVMEYVKIPGRLFAGTNGKDLAATYISKTWRMYKQKKQYKFMKMFNDSANVIKEAYRRYRTKKQFREKLMQKYKEELVRSQNIYNRGTIGRVETDDARVQGEVARNQEETSRRNPRQQHFCQRTFPAPSP